MTTAKKKHKVAYWLTKTQNINFNQANLMISYMTPDNFNTKLEKAEQWITQNISTASSSLNDSPRVSSASAYDAIL